MNSSEVFILERIYILGKANPKPPRLIAYELVYQVNREGAYANIRLPELLGKSQMTTLDKAFTTELAYGTLRMQGRHDFIASKFLDRKPEELDTKIQDLLRIGIHQLTQMRVPDHAAVSETVEVAKLVAGESKASYVNAILRKIAPLPNDLSEINDLPPLEKFSIQYSHPQWIVSSFYDQLKNWEEVEKLLFANNLPATPDIVAWPGKSKAIDFVKLGASPIPELPNGVNLTGIPSEFDPIIKREAGVQDRGSQIVVENFLATRTAGQSWLDMCAGPGGKAAYLYHSLLVSDPDAQFLANEPIPHRAELVKRVVNNNQVVSCDGTEPSNFGQRFDRILVDAPCTGLGALRRRPESRWRRNLTDLKELVDLQKRLLESAYKLLTPNGIIAYVTCSPHVAETKGQVIDFLANHEDLSLIPLQKFNGVHQQGLLPDGTMQLWTHRNQSDGMFMALFQKKG